MENKEQGMNSKDHKNSGHNASDIPPELFSERRPVRSSKKKFFIATALFALVSALILLLPHKVSVKGMGQAVPAKIYSVGAETAGKIAEVYCIEGTQVIAGSPIIKLSNEKLASTIEETQKRREAALGRLGVLNAEKSTRSGGVERSKLYYEVGSISLREKRQTEDLLLAIEREIVIQNKEVEEIDASLNYLLAQKEKEIIKAPADGVILTPLKDHLEMVLSEGQEVFKLAGKEMAVEVFVPEEQMRFVCVGSQANLRFVSNPLKTYHGSVLRLDSKVETQQEKVWITKSGVWVTIGISDAIEMTPGKKAYVQIFSEYRHSLIANLAARFLFCSAIG